MTPEEMAVDLLVATIGDTAQAIVFDGLIPAPSNLADGILGAIEPGDAHDVIGCLVGIGSVLLAAVAQHTGNAPEDILHALQAALR